MPTRAPRGALVLFTVVLAAIAITCLSVYGSSEPMSAAHIAAAKMPNLVSTNELFYMRCAMLAVNLLATTLKLATTEDKLVIHDKDSALAHEVPIYIHGPMWFAFFTVQSWTLQTLYLLGATACSAISVYSLDVDVGGWLPTALWMSYEISFAVALLVSFIVKYVLIPTVLEKKGNADNFFTPSDLLMHNCNTLFMALELLFNDLPFTFSHFPLAVLWGFHYVYFSWVWMGFYGVVWYDFLDPTLPKAIVTHLVLVTVLGVFFALGAGFAAGAAAISSPYVRIAIVLAGVATVAKTGLFGMPKGPKPAERTA